jgi:hypothetical protein
LHEAAAARQLFHDLRRFFSIDRQQPRTIAITLFGVAFIFDSSFSSSRSVASRSGTSIVGLLAGADDIFSDANR